MYRKRMRQEERERSKKGGQYCTKNDNKYFLDTIQIYLLSIHKFIDIIIDRFIHEFMDRLIDVQIYR